MPPADRSLQLRQAAAVARQVQGGGPLQIEVIHRTAPPDPPTTPVDDDLTAFFKEVRDFMATVKETVEKIRLTVERTEGRMASVAALITAHNAEAHTIADNAADDAQAVTDLLALNDGLEASSAALVAAAESIPTRIRPGEVQPQREQTNAAGFPIAGTAPGPVEGASPGADAVRGVSPSDPAAVEPRTSDGPIDTTGRPAVVTVNETTSPPSTSLSDPDTDAPQGAVIQPPRGQDIPPPPPPPVAADSQAAAVPVAVPLPDPMNPVPPPQPTSGVVSPTTTTPVSRADETETDRLRRLGSRDVAPTPVLPVVDPTDPMSPRPGETEAERRARLGLPPV